MPSRLVAPNIPQLCSLCPHHSSGCRNPSRMLRDWSRKQRVLELFFSSPTVFAIVMRGWFGSAAVTQRVPFECLPSHGGLNRGQADLAREIGRHKIARYKTGLSISGSGGVICAAPAVPTRVRLKWLSLLYAAVSQPSNVRSSRAEA